jgi:hypothetical protein
MKKRQTHGVSYFILGTRGYVKKFKQTATKEQAKLYAKSLGRGKHLRHIKVI